MNENIMENNEAMEAAEEMVTSGSGIGLKLIGGALLLGGAIYGGIKLRKKIKAKKEEDVVVVDAADVSVVEKDVEVEEKKDDKKKKN